MSAPPLPPDRPVPARAAAAGWSLLLLALTAAMLWTPAGAGMWGGGTGQVP